MNSIHCDIFYHKSITSQPIPHPFPKLICMKIFQILDAARLDEFFDHTGLKTH
jgi:hypothetical protein